MMSWVEKYQFRGYKLCADWPASYCWRKFGGRSVHASKVCYILSHLAEAVIHCVAASWFYVWHSSNRCKILILWESWQVLSIWQSMNFISFWKEVVGKHWWGKHKMYRNCPDLRNHQWWANPNLGLDLNRDLNTFGVIWQFKDLIQQPTIGIRFVFLQFDLAVRFHSRILAGCYSSASVERLFGVLGFLMSAHRNRLNVTTVGALLLWLELLWEWQSHKHLRHFIK